MSRGNLKQWTLCAERQRHAFTKERQMLIVGWLLPGETGVFCVRGCVELFDWYGGSTTQAMNVPLVDCVFVPLCLCVCLQPTAPCVFQVVKSQTCRGPFATDLFHPPCFSGALFFGSPMSCPPVQSNLTSRSPPSCIVPFQSPQTSACTLMSPCFVAVSLSAAGGHATLPPLRLLAGVRQPQPERGPVHHHRRGPGHGQVGGLRAAPLERVLLHQLRHVPGLRGRGRVPVVHEEGPGGGPSRPLGGDQVGAGRGGRWRGGV